MSAIHEQNHTYRLEAELATMKHHLESALELIRQHQADKAGLHEELARVKRQNAAMREAIDDIERNAHEIRARGWLDSGVDVHWLCRRILKAKTDTAGSDYISKESVKPLVEALKMAYHEINTIHARCGVPWWDTGKSDVTQEYFTSVVEASRSALAHAKSLGLPAEKEAT